MAVVRAIGVAGAKAEAEATRAAMMASLYCGWCTRRKENGER